MAPLMVRFNLSYRSTMDRLNWNSMVYKKMDMLHFLSKFVHGRM